jgi:hypothetical protein
MCSDLSFRQGQVHRTMMLCNFARTSRLEQRQIGAQQKVMSPLRISLA